MFGQLAIIMQTRHINLKDVFCYPLSIYPLSRATNIGFIRKTSKASLLQSLEKNVQPGVIRQDTTNVVNVMDGMTLIRKIKVILLFLSLRNRFSNITTKPIRTDLVVDVYKENSIKDTERVRSTGDVRFRVIRGKQPIKQWGSFLSCCNNKKALINFLVDSTSRENIACYQFRTMLQNNYRQCP